MVFSIVSYTPMHKASVHTAANCSVLGCTSCIDIRTTIVIYAIQ